MFIVLTSIIYSATDRVTIKRLVVDVSHGCEKWGIRHVQLQGNITQMMLYIAQDSEMHSSH